MVEMSRLMKEIWLKKTGEEAYYLRNSVFPLKQGIQYEKYH